MACLKPHIANEIKAVLDHGPIVQGRERFLDLLLKENHVNEVHSLLSEICDVGFAEAEVRAICVEVSSSDTATFDFNRKLQHQSQGKLNLSPDAMRYATIAASHLNAALQCIQGCVYHDDERLTVDGKISHKKLGSLDSQYLQASVNGVEWLVISRSLLDEFPQVASMVSASMNVGSHLARQEFELELLSKISDVMIAKDKEVLTWAEISTKFSSQSRRWRHLPPSCSSSLARLVVVGSKPLCIGAGFMDVQNGRSVWIHMKLFAWR